MSRRLSSSLVAAAIAVLVIVGVLVVVGRGGDDAPSAPPADAAGLAAQRFLDTYLATDGRVVRHDQGGDTVSEGQAYAMLVAVAIGDRTSFDHAWHWAQTNLVQSNGLMAWRWEDGKVVDTQSATDADLDAARALVLADRRWNGNGYLGQAQALAKAVADFDVFYAHDGKPVLMAGPWATREPYLVNPSYHAPRTEEILSAATSDTRWASIAEKQRSLTADLLGTDKRPSLPSDWGRLDPSRGAVTPSAAAGQTGDPKYSFDAMRVPIRLAESCDAIDRAQAAKLWPLLSAQRDARTAQSLSLSGAVMERSATPLAAVASAAAAKASGSPTDMTRLLERAERMEIARSTYYGSAWVALGRIMLTTNWLESC